MRENGERAPDGDPIHRMLLTCWRLRIARVMTGAVVVAGGAIGGGYVGGRAAVEGSHLVLGLKDEDPAKHAAAREVQEQIEALRRDAALRTRLDDIATQSANLKKALPSWVEALPDWESMQVAKMFLHEHVTAVVDWLESVLAFLAKAAPPQRKQWIVP